MSCDSFAIYEGLKGALIAFVREVIASSKVLLVCEEMRNQSLETEQAYE